MSASARSRSDDSRCSRLSVGVASAGARANESDADERKVDDDEREKSDSMCVSGSRFVLLSASLRL
jgi:hypothetical protein